MDVTNLEQHYSLVWKIKHMFGCQLCAGYSLPYIAGSVTANDNDNGICWCSSRWRISLHLSVDHELRFNINQYWNNRSICMPMNACRNEGKCKMCTHKSIEPRSPVNSMLGAFANHTLCVQSRACMVYHRSDITVRVTVSFTNWHVASNLFRGSAMLYTLYNPSNSHSNFAENGKGMREFSASNCNAKQFVCT